MGSKGMGLPMKRIHLAFLLCLLIAGPLPFTASAEGRCPPGQYPIGDQGVGGCAPIPGAQGGESGTPMSTGVWQRRWGAIAQDVSAREPGSYRPRGAAVSQKSKRVARSLAVDACRSDGGQKCQVWIAFRDQCVAIADPVGTLAPGATSVVRTAGSEVLARSGATRECREKLGQACEIAYSGCSLP
ncbi:TPA: DUF4189 domain-containing protein [Stenotrophomonas maltophilia]